jgi:hypothetical protein
MVVPVTVRLTEPVVGVVPPESLLPPPPPPQLISNTAPSNSPIKPMKPYRFLLIAMSSFLVWVEE